MFALPRQMSSVIILLVPLPASPPAPLLVDRMPLPFPTSSTAIAALQGSESPMYSTTPHFVVIDATLLIVVMTDCEAVIMHRGSDLNAASIGIGEVMRNLLKAAVSWESNLPGTVRGIC